jgi:adenosylhomocysteine nucleosidase
MTYGLIGAMEEEIEGLQKQMKNKETHNIAGSLFIEGTLCGKDVILVKSGIGKVNAAMTTTILLERFKPTQIINTGSAGGFLTNQKVGDIVIGEKVVYHDVDVTAFDYEYGQVPGLPAKFAADEQLMQKVLQALEHLHLDYKSGVIATGDAFMNNPEHVNMVKTHFPEMIAAEMEAAAIAQVCVQYGVPFIVIRALSDIAGGDAPMSFEVFLTTAAENAANLIMEIVAYKD